MAWYIATDSDWQWNDDEGGTAQPLIVEAETPDEAARKALALAEERGEAFDGVHFKIGEITLRGFIGWDSEAGWDDLFYPVTN